MILAFGLPVTLLLAWHHGEKGRQRLTASEIVSLGVITTLALGSVWLVRDRAPEGTAPAPWTLPGPPEATERRIAILPFANLSPAAEADAYLADGLHEEIITQVSKISALDVVSRTSVMRFRDPEGRSLPQIAAELGVWHILEGSVRRAGDQLRVTAQLIDARTDGHLWSETYDHRHVASAMFEMQSDVAIEIAEALSANLAPTERTRIERRPTKNDDAYDTYLRGLHTYTGSSATTLEGNAHFLRAVELDPSFAEAWAQLANTYAAMGNFYLALSLEQMGRLDEAVGEIRRAAEGDNRDAAEVAALEGVYAVGGMAAVWEQWLDWHLSSPTQRPGPIAISYARLATADEAFEWIARACDRYDSWMFQLNDPLWDPIRHDPRFVELRRRLNLPPTP